MSEPVTAPADRIWTIPNLLSFLRLLGVPLFLWLLLGPHADGWALVVLALSALTDWADGKLARLLNQYSKLGEILDPAADRLYILATLVAFVIRGFIPWWVAALLIGRDLLLAACLPILRRHGYGPLPVHYLGKAATFCLLYAFPLVLLAQGDSTLAQHRAADRLRVHRLGHAALPVVRSVVPVPGAVGDPQHAGGEPRRRWSRSCLTVRPRPANPTGDRDPVRCPRRCGATRCRRCCRP